MRLGVIPRLLVGQIMVNREANMADERIFIGNQEKPEVVDVVIGGGTYTVPKKLSVSEMAKITRMASYEDDDSPESKRAAADMMDAINDIFKIYNSPRKIAKMRIDENDLTEFIKQVYYPKNS